MDGRKSRLGPEGADGTAKWFFAVFDGMTRLRSSKPQAPSPKPQCAARALDWSLRFGASLELGAWGLGFWCAPKVERVAEGAQRTQRLPALACTTLSSSACFAYFAV